jgi:hypothetical protein
MTIDLDSDPPKIADKAKGKRAKIYDRHVDQIS